MTETVAARRTSRRTSSLTAAAGALFVVVPVIVQFVAGDAFLLMGLALLLVLAALPGLGRVQMGRDGAWGRWGLRLTGAGLGTMVVLVLSGDALDAWLGGTAQDVAEGVWLLAATVAAVSALVGIVSFSIGMTRARVLDPSGIWLFLGGMTAGLISESIEQSLRGPVPWSADAVPPVAFAIAGCGLLTLARSARRAGA